MKWDHEYDKTVELHESEWKKDGKREPILGNGAYWFFMVTIPTIIVAIITAKVVSLILTAITGYSPYH